MMNGNDFRLYQGMDFSDFLAHYGKGHLDGGNSGRYKWGSGKNPRQRSGKRVFVSGSSKTQDKESGYYRRKLPKAVRQELDAKMKNGDTILVGDAPGIDRQVQDYLKKKRYKNVEVYGPGTEVRYQANKDWKTNLVDDPEHEKGSPEWLAKKDIAMSESADEGIAVILDEGAKATRNNIARLIADDKSVDVYELNSAGKKFDKWLYDNGQKTIYETCDAVSTERLKAVDKNTLFSELNKSNALSKLAKERYEEANENWKNRVEDEVVSKFSKEQQAEYKKLYNKYLKEFNAKGGWLPKGTAADYAAQLVDHRNYGIELEFIWEGVYVGVMQSDVKPLIKDLGYIPSKNATLYVAHLVEDEFNKKDLWRK